MTAAVPSALSNSTADSSAGPGARWPLPLLLALSVAYRLPYLLNPALLNSDGAVVGLQARQFFHGGASWFLWGTNYQSSFDALAHALVFSVFGASPFTMLCGSLAALLLMNALIFLTLRRHLGAVPALIATLPLVFAPAALNQFVQHGFRQWSLTCFAGAVFLLDAGTAATALFGALAGVLMLYLDLFTLQLAPALLLFALLGDQRRWKLAGGVVGAAFLLWVRRGLGGDTPTHLHLAPNLQLFAETSSWLIGARALTAPAGGAPGQWPAPWPLRLVQLFGPALFVAGIAFGAVALFFRRLPWPARRLGLLGFVTATCTAGGFLFSTMPYDLAAVRYLAPIIVAAPLALAPAAALLGTKRFALGLAPYLLVAAVAGWLSYDERLGRFWLPVRTARGTAHDELEVAVALRARGIHAAAADYWLAYRLSFIWNEDPVVANIDGWERMPAYRAAYNRAPLKAMVFHPSVPQTPAAGFEAQLRQRGVHYQREEIAGFTVLIFPAPEGR